MAFPVHTWTPSTKEEEDAHNAHTAWLLDGNQVRVAPHAGKRNVLLWRIYPADREDLSLWVRADKINAHMAYVDCMIT